MCFSARILHVSSQNTFSSSVVWVVQCGRSDVGHPPCLSIDCSCSVLKEAPRALECSRAESLCLVLGHDLGNPDLPKLLLQPSRMCQKICRHHKPPSLSWQLHLCESRTKHVACCMSGPRATSRATFLLGVAHIVSVIVSHGALPFPAKTPSVWRGSPGSERPLCCACCAQPWAGCSCSCASWNASRCVPSQKFLGNTSLLQPAICSLSTG